MNHLRFPTSWIRRGVLLSQPQRCNMRCIQQTNYKWYSSTAEHNNCSVDYMVRVDSGKIQFDRAQLDIITELDKLSQRLSKYEPRRNAYYNAMQAYHESLIQHKQAKEQGKSEDELQKILIPKPARPRVPRGMYLWGHVGTGKTMMLDLFFNHTKVDAKRRVHFHDFMLEVQERIHLWKKQRIEAHGRDDHIDLSSEGDAVKQVAVALSRESTVLAFDEFVVNNVVDALMMRHLFTELFAQGTVVVATSNTAPEDLYPNGLNRDYFLPFIDILKGQCKVYRLPTTTDYRFSNAMKSANTQSGFISISKGQEDEMETIANQVFHDHAGVVSADDIQASRQGLDIPVMFGRSLHVAQQFQGTAIFTFEELCGSEQSKLAKYAPDYKSLCEHFHTIIISHVPVLPKHKANDARRFVTLVDQLYDRQVQLIILSEAREPHEILAAFEEVDVSLEDGPSNHSTSMIEMQTALKRTISRLHEMTSNYS